MTASTRVVFRDSDGDGPLEVIEEADGKLRSLHFGSPARQSTMFPGRPNELALEYTRLMASALVFLDADPQRVLVLGLGGGSLPKDLLHRFTDCRVEVVERRQLVVDVAAAHFALPVEDERLTIHLTDGAAFLRHDTVTPYDLVLVDLHDAAGMAACVDEPDFAGACRRVTTAGGLAVFNLWYGVRPAQEARLRARLQHHFDPLLELPVAGKKNCVAYGFTAPVPPRQQLLTRLQADADLPFSAVLQSLAQRYPRVFG